MNDEFYMNLAINEAWKYQILTYPNPAVGCVIVDKFGKILAIKAHQKAGLAHAELSAVISAFEAKFKDTSLPKNPSKAYEYILANHDGFLNGAKAFVTLEPCSHHGKTPPCANLLNKLGFSEVIIGSYDNTDAASGGGKLLQKNDVKVKFGILKERCDELLAPFLAWQSGNFSFLKLGMSLNGVVSGGVITGLGARVLVHKIRSVLPLLAIGGNTVRIDRPTLDSRLANGIYKTYDAVKTDENECKIGELVCSDYETNIRAFDEKYPSKVNKKNYKTDSNSQKIDSSFCQTNDTFYKTHNANTFEVADTYKTHSTHNPDVFIYSRQKEFDKTIPLFSIAKRKVIIGDDIKFVRSYPLCMFEGGQNLLANLPEFVEYVLIFFAPNFLNLANLSANLKLKLLNLCEIDGEFYGWFKIVKK
ncbi:bifunctional diaminohydroxyphosphoribosylaminopyrimidine deaminase/5-amino-6-(5-phosphoribosylamino)uracil reductase RibD [Campylobacter geochelonis]|uniref:bifunctional diaminohydroxyphosphoribosylaminopyrimidine deaminase/5-amino-6-(5-phosphoribosylamino)uracil reductase RibD n=1 Tax=Campylobacter geochelonis TaxID=1780362 RepID=UPI000770874C|nr:bifunctional diaminohydroxyphosphoribosylaminopyrimidine deaminase/5-amino-6-(5-phosphoribosylamino)uracil reductase RibD [Campylobacter geochelonis]CZE47255.1 riboflavin biosynthesis protein RibD [Campylobacter geochelonis]